MTRERTNGGSARPGGRVAALGLLGAALAVAVLVPAAAAQGACPTALENGSRAGERPTGPGGGLAVAIDRHSEDLGSALSDRRFDARLANASTDRERARVVAAELERIAARLRALERCTGHDPLAGTGRATERDRSATAPRDFSSTGSAVANASRWRERATWRNVSWWGKGVAARNGSADRRERAADRPRPTAPDGARPGSRTRRERAAVLNETRSLERRLNETQRAAADLPAWLRQRHDIDETSLAALEWRVDDLERATAPPRRTPKGGDSRSR